VQVIRPRVGGGLKLDVDQQEAMHLALTSRPRAMLAAMPFGQAGAPVLQEPATDLLLLMSDGRRSTPGSMTA